MPYCLGLGLVVQMNHDLVDATGEPFAVVNRSGLESALGRPLGAFAGVEVYPTIPAKAGALLDGLAQAHSFQQGNKRTAWLAAVTYLGLNGLNLVQVTQDDAAEFVLTVVEHGLDAHAAGLWFAEHVAIAAY